MRIAHILVCHSYDPTPLFRSIPRTADAMWHIFMHKREAAVEKAVLDFAYDRGARVYCYGENRGLARSWNEAIFDAFNAGAEAFLLLNDDTFFYENQYLEFIRVIKIVSQATDISYITTDGFEPHMDGGRVIPQNFACCALTRRCIELTGYFDENFFPVYHEDVDYFVRSTRLGLHPHVETRTLIQHQRGGTSALFSPEQQQRLEHDKRACHAYFLSKWGSDSPSFLHPFDDDRISYHIPFASRCRPYGPQHDRKDLPDVG